MEERMRAKEIETETREKDKCERREQKREREMYRKYKIQKKEREGVERDGSCLEERMRGERYWIVVFNHVIKHYPMPSLLTTA